MKEKNLRGCYGGTLQYRKLIAKGIAHENKEYSKEFVPLLQYVPESVDRNGKRQKLLRAWRNNRFVVQLYENGDWLRLSVNRSEYDPKNDCWVEGISWDEIMEIKEALGFGDRDAIEIYPKDNDVIYVTNMRHLFIVPEERLEHLDCIWRKS